MVVALLVGAAVATGAILGWPRWRRRPSGAPPARPGPAPADYRPSFPTYGDQQDTVEDRAALAREDVTRLGEELDAADPPLTDPAVAAHVQAALDAYADASRRVDALTTDDELRQLGQVTEYARWQLACARGRGRRDPTAGAPAALLRRPRARRLGRGRVVGTARGHAPTGPGLPGLLRPADRRGHPVRIDQ